MIDIRINGIPWKEFSGPGKAAIFLGCGYYKNGTFDFTMEEAAERIIRAKTTPERIKREAQAFLDGEAEEFLLEWVDEENW